MPRRVLLASGNAGKLAELRRLAESSPDMAGIEIIGAPPELPPVEEDADTFKENAIKKALSAARDAGFAAVADDSGLCIPALGDFPGIYSARWAGAMASDSDRNRLLLDRLTGLAKEDRAARFVCAMAVASPSGAVDVVEGTVHGVIADMPRGDGGFGYDPIFLIPEMSRTMAELSPSEKDAYSHRGRAFIALLPFIPLHA